MIWPLSGAEIGQIFRWFFGKFEIMKKDILKLIDLYLNTILNALMRTIPVHLSSGSSSSQARPEQGLAWTKWGHPAPPLEAWCKMTRWRSVHPPAPHLTEQGDHGPHSDSLQSWTRKEKVGLYFSYLHTLQMLTDKRQTN